MGIKSLTVSISLALLLASTLGAQERSGRRSHTITRSASALGYSTGSQRALRSSSYRNQRVRGYGQRNNCPPQRSWIQGYNSWVSERYWVAESYEQVWVAPVYGWGFDQCGLRVRICTQAGHWNRVCRPGYFSSRRVQRWIPGHWG